VYSKALLPKVAQVMQEIGYQRAMVVHGFDASKERGMDELLNIGESVIHEFHPDGTENTFSLAPEDVGLKRATYGAIAATGDVKKEAVRFLCILGGSGTSACTDLTCLNAGVIFYLVGKAGTIQDGVKASRDIIESGQALAKLSERVSVQAGKGIHRYLEVASAAGLRTQVMDQI
jgi:anthranilate phosphoribosyltransferase